MLGFERDEQTGTHVKYQLVFYNEQTRDTRTIDFFVRPVDIDILGRYAASVKARDAIKDHCKAPVFVADDFDLLNLISGADIPYKVKSGYRWVDWPSVNSGYGNIPKP